MAERDARLREHVETIDYIDPETRESYRPDPLPVIYDPVGWKALQPQGFLLWSRFPEPCDEFPRRRGSQSVTR